MKSPQLLYREVEELLGLLGILLNCLISQIEEPSPVEKMSLMMGDIEESWPVDVIEVERKNIESDGIISGESKRRMT